MSQLSNLFSAILGLFRKRTTMVVPANPQIGRPPVVVTKPSVATTVITHPATKAVAVATVATWLVIATPFVAGFEGYFSRFYRDPVGVGTICYGITAGDLKYTGASFKGVYTEAECRQFLEKDLQRYDNDLKRLLKADVYAALPPHRHAALVSFDYNLGAGNLAHITPYFNAGNWRAGCQAMLAYHNAGGRSLPGLVRRRNAEYALCMRTD